MHKSYPSWMEKILIFVIIVASLTIIFASGVIGYYFGYGIGSGLGDDITQTVEENNIREAERYGTNGH